MMGSEQDKHQNTHAHTYTHWEGIRRNGKGGGGIKQGGGKKKERVGKEGVGSRSGWAEKRRGNGTCFAGSSKTFNLVYEHAYEDIWVIQQVL